MRDPKIWLLTTFCSSSNLAETKASRVLESISFSVFGGDLVARVRGGGFGSTVFPCLVFLIVLDSMNFFLSLLSPESFQLTFKF